MSVWEPAVAGRLIDVPALSTTKSGRAVARFRFAPDRRYGEVGEHLPSGGIGPVWSCCCHDELAAVMASTMRRGQRVLLTGILRQVHWTGRDGIPQDKVEFVVVDCGLSLLDASAMSRWDRQPDGGASDDEPWAV